VHKTKAYPAKFATLDEKEGRVEALVSIFGNVDLVGDRVVKGAFSKSIQKWKASNDPVPAILSHDWGDPWKHIGVVDSLEETDEGLRAVYTLDIDDNPLAKQVYKLMKRRSLKEHSFAYDVKREKNAKDGANELLELDIIEIGPTLKGVNPSTEVLAVKAVVESQEREAKSPPWHIEKDKSGCDGYAVVVDETSKVVGCHETRAGAERQLAALYSNVDDADKAKRNVQVADNVTSVFRAEWPDGTVTFMPDDNAKAGRTISKKTESDIRSAVEILQQILSSVEEAPEEEKSTSPEEEQEVVEDKGNGKATASDDLLLRLKAEVVQGV
jgi:HK97 family phage prohead protease